MLFKIIIFQLLLVNIKLITLESSVSRCPGRNVISNTTRGKIFFSKGATTQQENIQFICQWKIYGIDGKIININVTKFTTKCSNTYLRLQDGCDGDNVETKVVALLSGMRQHLLDVLYIFVKSCVQIDFYSGLNDLEKVNIELNYNLRNCPLTCDKYNCPDGKCSICDNGRVGRYCQLPKGECEGHGEALSCKCPKPSQLGYYCSLTRNSYHLPNEYGWHVISPLTFPEPEPDIEGRLFAASTFVKDEGGLSNMLYLHGGHNLNGKLFGDLRFFSINRRKWMFVNELLTQPEPRFGHSLTPTANEGEEMRLFLYGGYLNIKRDKISGDLWRLSRLKYGYTWRRLICHSNCPPALAFHTMTARSNQLWLFGGIGEDGDAHGRLYRITLGFETFHAIEESEIFGWSNRLRVFGHTAVYDQKDDRLLVFGGMRYVSPFRVITEPALSSYSFYHNTWSLLSEKSKVYRVFHSALIVGDFLIVYGGCLKYNTDVYPTYDNNCFDDLIGMELFHLRCSKWSILTDFYNPTTSEQRRGNVKEPVARFGQNVFLFNDYTMVIFGGFSGIIRNDILAFVFPPSIIRKSELSLADHENICQNNPYKMNCIADSMCIWDDNTDTCHYYKAFNRNASPLSNICIGTCPSLSTCSACTKLSDSTKWWSHCVWSQTRNYCISNITHSGDNSEIIHSISSQCNSSPAVPQCIVSTLTNCADCLNNNVENDAEFVWSKVDGRCYNSTCWLKHHSLSFPASASYVRKLSHCYNCAWQPSCFQCGNSSDNCFWDSFRGLCVKNKDLEIAAAGNDDDDRISGQICQTCRSHTSCNSCLTHGSAGCLWCPALSLCLSKAERSTRLVQNCLNWLHYTSSSTQQKRVEEVCSLLSSCSQHRNCNSCLRETSTVGFCAWLYNTKDPFRAECVTLPLNNTVKKLVGYTVTTNKCQLINECAQPGFNNCHPNAVCIDTEESYSCECKPGYEGNGYTECRLKCFPECVHGRCSNVTINKCDCDLGFVGPTCNEDCNCNGHSHCTADKSTCLDCQHNTEGDRCQRCKRNHYGNATAAATSSAPEVVGCLPCECNGHGIPHKIDDGGLDDVLCHPISGECRCTNHTTGKHCQLCERDYFKVNSLPESPCAAKCEGKLVIDNDQGLIASPPLIGSCSVLFNSSQFDTGDGVFYVFQISTGTLRQLNCLTDSIFLYSGRISSSIYLFNISQSSNRLIHRLCVDTPSSSHLPDVFIVNASVVTLVAQLLGKEFVLHYRRISCSGGHQHRLYDPELCRQYSHSDPTVMVTEAHTRMGQSVTPCAGAIYQFGGLSRAGLGSLTNDLYRIEAVNGRLVWNKIVAKCRPLCPSSRAYHSAVCHPNEGVLIILGGVDESGHPAHAKLLFLYKISSNEWIHSQLPFNDSVTGLVSKSVTISIENGTPFLFIIGGILKMAPKKTLSLLKEDIVVFNSTITFPLNRHDFNKTVYQQSNDFKVYDSSFTNCSEFTSSSIIGSSKYNNEDDLYLLESNVICPKCLLKQQQSSSYSSNKDPKFLIFNKSTKRSTIFPSSVPCALIGSAMILLDNNDTILCFGGRNLDGTVTDSSIYLISVGKSKWATLPNEWVKHCRLRPLYGAKIIFVPRGDDEIQHLFIFGGLGPNNQPNDRICSIDIPPKWYEKVFTERENSSLNKLIKRSGCRENFLNIPCHRTCGRKSCLNWYFPGIDASLSSYVITFYRESGLAGPFACRESVSICQLQTYCRNCTALSGCGWWLSKSTAASPWYSGSGSGKCLPGGFGGPATLPATDDDVVDNSTNKRWYFNQCPMENECLNGHHNCNSRQVCKDTKESFVCKCRQNYRFNLKTNDCEPICTGGCGNGTCIAPQKCHCNFGYGGIDCQFACPCHGNSACDSDNRCLNCLNNSQGKYCELCKPGHVHKNGKCIACRDHCHGHSSDCEMRMIRANTPVTTIICNNCRNHTEGSRCHVCQTGYFRRENNSRLGCEPCNCNGHGSNCDPTTGLKCDCQNHTQSPAECEDMRENTLSKIIKCSKLQCSQCITRYIGNPAGSRQCYRSILSEKSTCINEGDLHCSEQPEYLPAGKSVFYYLNPRYRNVNMRLSIEIKMGLVDVFITSNSQLFGVTGDKVVYLNESINTKRYKRAVTPFDLSQTLPPANLHPRLRVSISHVNDRPNFEKYEVVKMRADSPAHYATLTSPHKVLHIEDIRHLFVLTVDASQYGLDLQSRFFLIIVAKELTQGDLDYRQVLPNVNLFVFFSVFFCSFFLLLAVCVLVWKLKIYGDRHRARIRESMARKTMAARPFRQILVWLDPTENETDSLLPPSPTKSPPFNPVPLAIEPVRHSSAAVLTLLIQLPGPEMCLGSTLTTTRSLYHHDSGGGGGGAPSSSSAVRFSGPGAIFTRGRRRRSVRQRQNHRHNSRSSSSRAVPPT